MFPNACTPTHHSAVLFTPHIIFLLPSDSFSSAHESPLCLNKSDSTINVRQALAVYSALSTSSASVDSFLSLSSNFLMVQARGVMLPVRKLNDVHKVNFFHFTFVSARDSGNRKRRCHAMARERKKVWHSI